MAERNPYLQALDKLEAAKKLYEELRWRLNFLTSLGGEQDQVLSDQQIEEWHDKLCKRPWN